MMSEHVYGVREARCVYRVREVRMQWKYRFKNLRDRFAHLGNQVLAS